VQPISRRVVFTTSHHDISDLILLVSYSVLILVFIVPVGIYSNVYISTKQSDSQKYMCIIINRLLYIDI
jgi:hypothetical protein